jgi:hypothetical protein
MYVSGLEFMILLAQIPECWDYRPASPHQAHRVLLSLGENREGKAKSKSKVCSLENQVDREPGEPGG